MTSFSMPSCVSDSSIGCLNVPPLSRFGEFSVAQFSEPVNVPSMRTNVKTLEGTAVGHWFLAMGFSKIKLVKTQSRAKPAGSVAPTIHANMKRWRYTEQWILKN